MSILQDLIPFPNGTITEHSGIRLSLSRIHSVSGVPAVAERLCRRLDRFGLAPVPVADGGTIELHTGRAEAGWLLVIDADKVRIDGASEADCAYAAEALVQLTALAARSGLPGDALPGGSIADQPRHAWRGFMIDSSRHFQRVDQLKQLIEALSALRFNVLHWHLTDHQSWRLADAVGDASLAEPNALEPGQYTRADIAEVVGFARMHHLEIVPEIDLPGHNAALCQAHSELACDPANPGGEVCLGKAEVRRFVGDLLREIMALFPDSRYIHIGGDEAESTHWEQCADCRAALAAAGLNSMRELENRFMREMAQIVTDAGRTPIVWATDGTFPSSVAIQCWYHLTDILKARRRGNRYINSVHSSTYLDYPACPEDPHADWMQQLSEEGVYLNRPALFAGDDAEQLLMGVEYCLWTEIIPAWRIFPKLFPRLWAAAEVAWGSNDQANYAGLVRRRRQLELAGYDF